MTNFVYTKGSIRKIAGGKITEERHRQREQAIHDPRLQGCVRFALDAQQGDCLGYLEDPDRKDTYRKDEGHLYKSSPGGIRDEAVKDHPGGYGGRQAQERSEGRGYKNDPDILSAPVKSDFEQVPAFENAFRQRSVKHEGKRAESSTVCGDAQMRRPVAASSIS